nr:FUSC family protein [Methanobacterium petrolearium]
MGKLRILSKPTGKPQWKQGIVAIFLMILAALVAKFLGFEDGIKAIMFITLIANIIIDLPLPLRKSVPLTVIGFLMTVLAFISSSLALSSLPLFLFFTILWSFFSLSTYIFSEAFGSFGFIIFCCYFLSVVLVNRDASPLDWGFYIVLAYMVASISFIPKLLNKKKDLSKLVASPFSPETSLERVLSIRQMLSGIPLEGRDYELFRIGTYLTGFRSYSKIVLSRLSGESREIFQKFIDTTNKSSSKIAASIISKTDSVDLESMDVELAHVQNAALSESSSNAPLSIAQNMHSLLKKANEIIVKEKSVNATVMEKLKIPSPRNSLKNVLGANFNLKNMYIRHALRFTLAMTIGLLVIYLTHERDAIWVTMGILIIIKPDVTSTLNNMIVRVSFNVIAIILAIVVSFIFPHYILFWIAFLMLFLYRAFYPTYMALSVMALTVFIILVWPTGTVFDNSLARIIDITIGAIIAFICAYIILPSRVTVNLPQQIAQTIRTNRKYVENVLPIPEMVYDHQKAVNAFRNYMLEEKNLESAIKKVEDTFDDVEDDLALYNDFWAANQKLAADISAVGTLAEAGENLPDISRFREQVANSLNEMALSVDKNIVLPRARIDDVYPNSGSDNRLKVDRLPEELHNYLNWITSDIHYLQELVEIAIKSGALKKYQDMA